MICIFDLECNGFLHQAKVIHVLSMRFVDGDSVSEAFTYRRNSQCDDIQTGLELMLKADTLCGHNIQDFDLRVIDKLYPRMGKVLLEKKRFDTLVTSRLLFSDRMEHSLESWGKDLKCPKGDFGVHSTWEKWTEPMEKYCEQDVNVTVAVYKYLTQKDNELIPEKAFKLEHEFADILGWQMREGIRFNLMAARELEANVRTQADLIYNEIINKVPDDVQTESFIPKVNSKIRGYQIGVPTIKVKTIPFNPGSRQQVVKFFQKKYKWNPIKFTEKGNPQLDGDVLRDMPYEEAKDLAMLFDARKLLGMVADGEKAWIKLTHQGRLYGRITHNGAVTGRCTHSTPNLSQVPRTTSYMGGACRALFQADSGHLLVGVDASGLELRNLAHYLHSRDQGSYTNTILNGDIHTRNKVDAGLETRDQAKRFIYALNYGAGDAELGHIVKPDADEIDRKIIGKDLRSKFLRANPAMRILQDDLRNVCKSRSYINGLDGRRIPIRESYRSLNSLLQSAGAIVMKQATVTAWNEAKIAGILGHPSLHVHDEFQSSIVPEHAEQFKNIAIESIREAGRIFGYKCPLDGEGKIGANWKETH